MKASLRLSLSLLSAFTALWLIGCAAPSVKVEGAIRKDVFVNLDDLLPLHPAYRLGAFPAERQSSLTALERITLRGPSFALAEARFSRSLLPPPGNEAWESILQASTLSVQQEDKASYTASLISLHEIEENERQAAVASLEHEFENLEQEASPRLNKFARETMESFLGQTVTLEANLAALEVPFLAAPNVPSKAWQASQEELIALRQHRNDIVEKESRKEALSLSQFWSEKRLGVERQIADFDRQRRGATEALLSLRGEQLSSDISALRQLGSQTDRGRPEVVQEQLSFLTPSPAQPGGAAPGRALTGGVEPSAEGRLRPPKADEAVRSCVREEVVSAVERIAARHFWRLSFHPQAGAEDVTESVKHILMKEFYPQWSGGETDGNQTL